MTQTTSSFWQKTKELGMSVAKITLAEAGMEVMTKSIISGEMDKIPASPQTAVGSRRDFIALPRPYRPA